MKRLLFAIFAFLLIIGSVQNGVARTIDIEFTYVDDVLVSDPEPPFECRVGDDLSITNNCGFAIHVEIRDASSQVLASADIADGNSDVLDVDDETATQLCVTYTTPKGVMDEECVTIKIPPVPTLTEWGLVALLVLLLGAGVAMAVKRRRVEAV